MNTYNHFITDLYNLLPDYQDKFLGIDEIVEEIPSGFVIRPSFNFGTSYQATNLRDAETNIIITLQIFKTHDSNIDILEVAEDIKEKVNVTELFRIDDYNYSVDKIEFIKQFESKYSSISVQIYATKIGKIVEEEPWNPDEDTLPLTFVATKNSTIGIKKVREPNVAGLQYRYGLDGEWLTYEIDTILPLNKGEKIQFRNTNNTFGFVSGQYAYFVMTGEIEAYGNIMSMLNNISTVSGYGLQRLFFGCSALTRGPYMGFTACGDGSFLSMFEGCVNLRTAQDLNIQTMRANTCGKMFFNCISLKKAPALPATTLGQTCYQQMFMGCTSLIQTPELQATTLTNNCYYEMFRGCTSLKKAPALPATTLVQSCYQNMFYGCTSLEEAPELPAEVLAASCYNSMFNQCINLKVAPILSSTTLASNCYREMFSNCILLTSPSPELPATLLSAGCYYNMFYACHNLESTPLLSGITAGNQSCYNMFGNCYSLSSVNGFNILDCDNQACQNMFQNCYSLSSFPEIPTTGLATNCFANFLNACSNIKELKVNFTEWNPANATTNWLQGAGSNGKFICHNTLPATPRDSSHIPQSWSIEYIEPYKRQLDYLQSTTSGEFIDSGIEFSLDGNFKIEAETSYQGAWRGMIIGTYAPNRLAFYLDWTSDYQLRAYAARGNNVYNNYSGIVTNEKHTVSLEYDSSTELVKFIVDGVVKRDVALPSGTITNTNNIRLFLDQRPSPAVIQNPVRIYSAKIWKADILVRNYIPVMDNNDLPGMFDQVSETIFYNQGGGAFTYGELS